MKSHLFMLMLMAPLASCVPKNEFIQLAQEKEGLENEVARLNETIRKNTQFNSELLTQKKEAQAAKDTLTQEKEEALKRAKATAEELEALKRTFEQFKVDRRTGMIGKKHPEVVMRGGKKLINAEIAEVTAATVRLVHSGGITVARLADLGPDLQWEAVWDEAESQAYEAVMARKDKERSEQFKSYMTVQKALLDTKELEKNEKRVLELEKLIPTLRTRLDEQRAELNNAYDNSSRQIRSLSRIEWDFDAPENSEIFVDRERRPITMGISKLERLFTLATAIRTTKDAGSAATAELARLKEVLENAKK